MPRNAGRLGRFAPCLVLLLAVAALSSGCARDAPWRTPEVDDGRCTADGEYPLIDRLSPQLTLAHVEYTERGNVFNRGCITRVYDLVRDAVAAGDPVALFVYVHGWKHNADPNDSNVREFRRLLQQFTAGNGDDRAAFPGLQSDSVGRDRQVIGIYVGWRGAVLARPVRWFENLTFWNRKRVAEDIGKGGVTELLLALRHLVYCTGTTPDGACSDDSENVYIVAGHSFGAGIVLSALNEHLLTLVEEATAAANGGPATTRRFNDALLLLNPAIEANQMLQTKELIATGSFADDQDVLMHVISSRGDKPTHVAFPAGRWLSTLFWNKKRLVRRVPVRDGCDAGVQLAGRVETEAVTLRESELLRRTVGNYPPFWTGLLENDGDDSPRWRFRPLTGRNCPRDLDGRIIGNHLYAPVNSPVQNIYTDKDFIASHNDIFNPKVVAYAATIVSESLALPRARPDAVADECLVPMDGAGRALKQTRRNNAFDFEACFDHFVETYCAANPEGCE